MEALLLGILIGIGLTVAVTRLMPPRPRPMLPPSSE